MTFEVAPVETKRQREAWLRLPWRLYRDHPAWVPNLLMLQREVIDPKKNPFFEHGEAQLFLATRDGEPVGRISAHIDRDHNEQHGEKTGFFGFFEARTTPRSSAALLDRRRSLAARARHGPLPRPAQLQHQRGGRPPGRGLRRTRHDRDAAGAAVLRPADRGAGLRQGDGSAGLPLGSAADARAHDAGGREDTRRPRPHRAPHPHEQAAPGGRHPPRHLQRHLERATGATSASPAPRPPRWSRTCA